MQESALQTLAQRRHPVLPGTTVYTGLLNARGTYESDLTVRGSAPTAFCW
jgi:4-methylaminobutanoate oxidase (formaldehyde-forming)